MIPFVTLYVPLVCRNARKRIVHRATEKNEAFKPEKEKAGTINATEKHVMPY